MAQMEPMDIDSIESDFDNKENAFQYNNVLSRTPCTEKGYEELDVSELNMKLRYSITPASSPMTKSLTGPCLDNRNCNAEDFLISAAGAENGNLTRSLNSTLTKTEAISKSKALPLQTLSTDPFVDSNRNQSIRRLLDPTDSVIISVNNANDVDENLSLPSPCSSVPDTPEATTPTKEIPKPGSSPIMRGLKSVLSMFRPSQSPILPADDKLSKLEILSPVQPQTSEFETAQVSTPVSENRQRDTNSSKRSSPLKDSLVFNDNIERELLWKDETTILFKDERIPVHKLFLQNPITTQSTIPKTLNTTVEKMDISCDESFTGDKTNTNTEESKFKNDHATIGESDEFLDCETTFTKNEPCVSDCNKLEIDTEVQMTGNVTFDLGNTAEKSGANAESNNILKTIDCVAPANSTVSAIEVPMSNTDVSLKMNENNANIIEATVNLLHSESNYYSKISVKENESMENKSQVNKELQLEDPNVPLATDEEVATNHGPINLNESQHSETHSIAIANNLKEGEEEKEPEHSGCVPNIPIDNPPDVCKGTSNNFDNPIEIICETSNVIDTKETIDIVAAMAVEISNVDIVKDCPASDNKSIDVERLNVIGDMPNIDKPKMPNILGSTQDLELQSNTNLLINNEEKRDDKNNEMLLNNDNLIDTIHDSKNIEGILSEGHNIIIEIAVTQTTKNEDDVSDLAHSGILLDKNYYNDPTIDKNVSIMDDSDKPTNDMPITQSNTSKDDMMVGMTDLPPPKDIMNLTNSPTEQSDMNDVINSTIVSSESKYPEINIVNNSIDIVMKDDLETKNESFSLELVLKSNVECEIDGKISVCDVTNTDSVVNNVLDNDREVPELIIGSDTLVSKSPLEIPLPEDDDIDQNILSPCNIQDSTTKICGVDSILSFDNDVLRDQVKEALHHTQENDGRTIIDVINDDITDIPHSGAIVHKEANEIQICISPSIPLHMAEADTVNKMEQSEPISGLKVIGNNNIPEINVSKDISMPEVIYENVEKDTSEINISKNMEDKVVEEKILSNTEQILSTTEETVIMNTEKYGEINNLEKCEHVNIEKIADENQKDFIVEKEVDEIDEEIITSANNSPYVSVTDLDKIVENIPNETLDEIDNPVAINTTFGFSPPASPKIVSKGYNFDFDEIDDPFTTKTKIRMSPTPDTPNQSFSGDTEEVKTFKEVPKKINKRKSQPERKKLVQKKNMNSTFNNKLPTKESKPEKHVDSSVICQADNVSTSHVQNNNSEDKPETSIEVTEYVNNQIVDDTRKSFTSSTEHIKMPVLKDEIHVNDEENKSLGQTLVISTEKSTSSSEQYFSLGTSSGEGSSVMNKSKNVFNLPEIDDMNFNPFATKSKMRMSPPPIENPISPLESTNDVSKSSFDVQQQQLNNNVVNKDSDITFDRNTNDSLPNTSNTTFPSKATNDIDTTVREILTEDEDTVEGPFLELDSLRETQKVSKMEVETDMLNFEEISSQERDENLDNGELFIDADAFEFLLNQNKSTTVVDSGKESLFLKFDPLFANRVSSDGILAALAKVQKRQSTPKKLTKPTQKDYSAVEKSAAGPSNRNDNCGPVEEYNDDLSSTVTKPMMVVNPAVSSILSQKKAATPKLNRRSLTFTSPAMAVIDRLLSLSGNSSQLDHDGSIPQVGREHSETDLAITQLRELLAEKEINVHTLRSESKELKERLAALEVQVKSLEAESADRLAKIKELNERLQDKTKVNKSMAIVVEEYERTIASLIAETEHDKKRNAEERMRLIKERDEQTAHLTSMEVSFSDLHSKYEKSKQIILSCKANEDIYKKSIKEFQDNFSKMQNNYELLKQHATSKLNHANQELEKMNRAHEAEVLKMNAMIKRKELHITSLEETLAQKTKANEELTAICDELINKVG